MVRTAYGESGEIYFRAAGKISVRKYRVFRKAAVARISQENTCQTRSIGMVIYESPTEGIDPKEVKKIHNSDHASERHLVIECLHLLLRRRPFYQRVRIRGGRLIDLCEPCYGAEDRAGMVIEVL